MANTQSLSLLTSKTVGTYLEQETPLLAMSYRGVREYNDATREGYGIQDTIDIKIPGNPSVQLGLTTVPEDITDVTVPYVLSDQDIYNTNVDFDFRRIKTQLVGGKLALVGNPNKNPNDGKVSDPNYRSFIDNYAYPSGSAIKGKLESVISEKARKAAFYTPIDVPSKLKPINAYSDISSVKALADKLGWMSSQRYMAMNVDDATSVSDSLQNTFVRTYNEKITKRALLGNDFEKHRSTLANIDLYQSNVVEITTEAPQFAVSPTFTVGSVTLNALGGVTAITFAGVNAVVTQIFNAGSKISIPTVNLFNNVNKVTLSTRLVICVTTSVNGDGAGNATVVLSEPLYATGWNANVASLPGVAAPAELFPAHTNNYCCIPMGLIANPLPLGDIGSADTAHYRSNTGMAITTYIQGVASTGVNTYRISTLCPTLAVPKYIINLMGTVN